MPQLATCNSMIRLLLVLLFFLDALAEKLPFRHFSTNEGLAGNMVHSIVRDSRGLLWFCTNDGLSRFDGHSFVTFGEEQGLGDQEINHFLEASDGVYWVGTAHGIARMNPRSRTDTDTPAFTNFLPALDRRAQWIHYLLEDNAGRIWIATVGGLCRMKTDGERNPIFERIHLPSPAEERRPPRVLALVQDHFKRIWAGGDRGLYRILEDGRTERYSRADGLPGDAVLSLAVDATGALWVGVAGGLCRVTPRRHARAVVDRVYKLADGLPDDWVRAVHPAGEWLWAGTVNGLVRLPLAAGKSLQVFRQANGLGHPSIEGLAEDQEGNLWIGSMGGGASRLAMDGFTTYGPADGLASVSVAAIMQAGKQGLIAISKAGRQFALNRFDGARFTAIRPQLPLPVTNFGWGWGQLALRDPRGGWWIGTSQGLVGYPAVPADKLPITTPRKFLKTSGELPGGSVFRVFVDSRGDIWISISGERANSLVRFVPRTGDMQRFNEQNGLPGPLSDDRSLASAFAEDSSGQVWIGFHKGGLFRFRDGRLVEVRPQGDVPVEGVRWIHRDSAGSLWIAGRKALLRVDEPRSEQPAFRKYSVHEGLATNFVLSLAEDHLGRIYIGSGRGVDRLDPKTGHVRHYGPADGLVGGDIRAAQRDHEGYLWFASTEGLSRYDPRQERRLVAPNVFISRVRVGTYWHTITDIGETQVSVPILNWRQNSFFVQFFGVGEPVRYQYQLEGLDSGWSESGGSHAVHYPGLQAGGYRFVVRAVNSDGVWSAQPAEVSFRITPPFWQAWWFRLMLAVLLLAALIAFHRMQVDKAVVVERIRQTIAKDLHDDVGATLCHAALLSDLVQREQGIQNAPSRERLEQISSACRRALDSMSDIVWAIDPEKDKSNDLIQRMRRFAEQLLASGQLRLHFSSGSASEVVLDPRVRHQMLLVLKEALHNVVRHSCAKTVHVEVSASASNLTLRITDDGCGLRFGSNALGNGIRSMHERVMGLGGTMDAKTPPDGGTTLDFTVPLGGGRRHARPARPVVTRDPFEQL